MKYSREWPIWLMIAAFALILFLYATSSGVGLVSDSYYYIAGAEGIRSGEGFARPAADGAWKPITHFPPLYSICLALANTILPDESAPKALQAIIFAGNAILAGLLVLWVTGNKPIAWLASLVWILSPVLLTQQLAAKSEGLFLMISLLFLWVMTSSIWTWRWKSLVFAGLLGSLGYLTRYAGAFLLLSGGIMIFIVRRNKLIDRVKRIMLFGCAGVLLPFLLAVRNFYLTGSTSNRILRWHPITSVHLFEISDTVFHWLIPLNPPGRWEVAFFGAIILALGAVVFLTLWVDELRSDVRLNSRVANFVSLTAVSIFSYLALLAVSISLFDASTPLDDRILSPVYALLLILVFVAIGYWIPKWRRWAVKGSVLILSLIVITWVGIHGVQAAMYASMHPAGFADPGWQKSHVINFIRQLDEDTIMYSNEIDAIYLLTGRKAYLIPVQWDPVKNLEQDDFEQQMEKMRSRLEEEHGYLITFSTLQRQTFFPSEKVLSEGLISVVQNSSGSVYSVRETP